MEDQYLEAVMVVTSTVLVVVVVVDEVDQVVEVVVEEAGVDSAIKAVAAVGVTLE